MLSNQIWVFEGQKSRHFLVSNDKTFNGSQLVHAFIESEHVLQLVLQSSQVSPFNTVKLAGHS